MNNYDTAFGSLPDHDMKIVINDFNAKLLKEHTYVGTTDKHSMHSNINTNDMKKTARSSYFRNYLVT